MACSGFSGAAAPGSSSIWLAVDLLNADHIAVKKLFTAYRKLCDNDAPADEKRDLAAQICKELTVHAQIEEEIFYPEVREAIDGEALLQA